MFMHIALPFTSSSPTKGSEDYIVKNLVIIFKKDLIY